MNTVFLDPISHISKTLFPNNKQLSVSSETNIIESEPAITTDEPSTGSILEEQTASQSSDSELMSSSSSSTITESISNPEEKLSSSGNSTTTPVQDSTSNLFSFDLGDYVDDFIITMVVILSSFCIYLVIHYTLKRSADSLNIKERRIKGIDSLIKTILIVISAIIILFQFSTMSATVAGFISIGVGSVIGFSSRNTISNAIAGIILLSSRPFRLGDRVQIGNAESLGDVIEISLIFTKIKTIKNEMVTIPNQVLLQNQIKNYSGYKFLALSILVSAGYNEDERKIKSLLLKAADSTYGLLKEPKPYVLLKELSDFAAVYELMAYTEKANMSIQIKSDLRTNVYNLFKEAKIDLTTPRIVDTFRNKEDISTNDPRSSSPPDEL
jgi:small-conductance mechanosensitive channel